MAHLAPGTRPQTLRQAKRAYRKSSAKPKLSASEIAMAERRAVLQERADRIKEREARRKANLRKKEERKEAERERLMKEGKTLAPQTRGFKVGPSQLDLARFLPGFVRGGAREGDGDETGGKGGIAEDGSLERPGVLGQGKEENGSRSPGNLCDKRRFDGDAVGLKDREEDGLRNPRDLEKNGVSFDMFDDADEQEGQEKSESECRPDSNDGKKQVYGTDILSTEFRAGLVNRFDLNDHEGALRETQHEEIRPRILASPRSWLKEQGTNSAKRLRLEKDSIKTQSPRVYDSTERVKQMESKKTQNPDKNKPTSVPSWRSPLRVMSTNSIQRLKCEASKAMPPPRAQPSPTIVAITSFDDDFFPSNTQVEREISPCPPKKPRTISMNPPKPQAKMMPVLQPLPEDPHAFLASISTQDLDFSGMFTQVAPSKTSIAPPSRPDTPPQPQQLPQQYSVTKPPNPQGRNKPFHHHDHQQNSPSTPPFNDSLTTENELLANISTQDLFSSPTSTPTPPPPSPPQQSLPTSSNAEDHPSSQFPTHLPPPPPRPKISAAAGTSTSFDLDDDGVTADDLTTIAVQVELAMSGSSAGTAASAKF